MTCHEIADYMQRHLDHDLNDQEAAALNAHTRHCSDCAEMFDRLKRLSAELDNLPKVVPAFSLVDAIMPQLDKIESERPIAIHQTAAEETPAQDNDDKYTEQRSLRPRATERRKRISWPLISGIAAAGLAVGLFLVFLNPIMPPSFSKSDTKADEATAADTAATGSSEPTANSASSDEVRIESTEAPPASTTDSIAGIAEKKLATDYTAENQSGDKIEVTEPYSSVPSDDADASRSNYEEVLPPAEKSASDNQQASEATDTAATADKADTADKAGTATDGGAGQESGSSLSVIAKDQNGEPMGITSSGQSTSVDMTNMVKSPNGEMAAAIVDRAVFIYSVQEGTVLLESNKLADEIGSLQWSDDSLALFFSVKDKDGQTVRYKVDTKEWSISKQ